MDAALSEFAAALPWTIERSAAAVKLVILRIIIIKLDF